MDPALEEKLQSIFSEWDHEEPNDVTSGDMPDTGDGPELADPQTWSPQDHGADVAREGAQGVRLRQPTVTPPGPDATVTPSALSDAPEIAPKHPGSGAISGPRPPPDSLDWKGLGNRLAAAELGAKGSRDAEHMFANIVPGYKERTDYGQAVAMAKQPLELAQAKQGFERGELANKTAQAGLKNKAAMDDPNSLQSQKARESVKAFFGDMKLPPGFDSWSANDVNQFANSGTLSRVVAAKNAAADDARKVADKTAKDESTAAALAESRKSFAPELKRHGIDPATASKEDIDRVLSDLRSRDIAGASHEVAVSNNALAAANEKRKAGDYAALGQDIPFAGSTLRYTGTGTPRSDDVDKVQHDAALYGAAIGGMDDLNVAMTEFAKHPSAETRDAVIAKTQAVSGHVNTAAGQGAMSKDEKAEMSKALGVDIATPGGIQAMYETLTGDDKKAAEAMTRRIKAARESMRSSAVGKFAPYHFAPSDGGTGGKIRVRRIADGVSGSILPADFDPAKYEKL